MWRVVVMGIFLLGMFPSLTQAECIPDVEDVEEGTETVELATSLGSICIELFRGQAPVTVENFLYYLQHGDIDGTFFHRNVPGFVLQGGGFRMVKNEAEQVPPKDGQGTQNEPCELDTPAPPPAPEGARICSTRGNERGTVALAKTALGPNTGTNQWFINLADNRTNLDNQNGGFTVFGRVRGNGMDVIDKIARLSNATSDQARWFSTPYFKVFGQLPVRSNVPLHVDGFGCFNPDNLAVVVDPNDPRKGLGDPLGEDFFFVSGDCGRRIAEGSFVANPGTEECSTPDLLAVGVVGPANLQIRTDPASKETLQFSLICEEAREALAQRILWRADFKRRFGQELVVINSARPTPSPLYYGELRETRTRLKISKVADLKGIENLKLFLFKDGTFFLAKNDGTFYRGEWSDPVGKGKKFFLTMDNSSLAEMLGKLSELSSGQTGSLPVDVNLDPKKSPKLTLSLSKKGLGTLSFQFNLLGNKGGPKPYKGTYSVQGKGTIFLRNPGI